MQKKFRQIGITGGIGSGKSLISKIFKCLGIPVYDADIRARELMTTDDVLAAQIKAEFGEEAYDKNLALNRAFLSQKVFGDPEKLKKLNTLVHPRVGADYKQWANQYSQTHPYVLKEAALLFESGSAKLLDKILVVDAPEALRIRRVLARDQQRSENQVKEIIRSQLPEKEKLKQADFVIVNDETQLVIPQVLAIHEKLVTA